jgi:hypothetical protein
VIRVSERTLLTLAFFLFVAACGAASLALGEVARLAPASVALVTLALIGVELFQAGRGRGGRRASSRHAVRKEPDRSPVAGRDELAMFAWLLLLPGFAMAGGLAFGLPVFLALYLRFRSRLGWTSALAAAAVLWFVLYGVLVLLLRVRLYEGLLRT